jgi:hypothetical protein
MPTVFVYLSEATYSGPSEIPWHSPDVGARHKVMLFLSQNQSSASEAAATCELARFGFSEISLKPGKPITVEALNAPNMHAFHKHYEEALTAGSSVVWYPDVLPHPAA